MREQRYSLQGPELRRLTFDIEQALQRARDAIDLPFLHEAQLPMGRHEGALEDAILELQVLQAQVQDMVQESAPMYVEPIVEMLRNLQLMLDQIRPPLPHPPDAQLALHIVKQVAPTKRVRVEIKGSALRTPDSPLQMEAIVKLGHGPNIRPRNPDNLRIVQQRLNETGAGMTVNSLTNLVKYCRDHFSPAGWTAANPNPLTGDTNLLRFTSSPFKTPLTPDERKNKMRVFKREWMIFVRSLGWRISELPMPVTTDDAQLSSFYSMSP